MSHPDSDKRLKVILKAEMTPPELEELRRVIGGLASAETVEIISREIRPPKPEPEPLVRVPEELKGTLGELSFDDYMAGLADERKSFRNSSWNALARLGLIKVWDTEGEGEPVKKIPMIAGRFSGGEESVRLATLTDKKQGRRFWELTSEQVREAGHFVDLDELAQALEEGWEGFPRG